jgi:hypothetical protein
VEPVDFVFECRDQHSRESATKAINTLSHSFISSSIGPKRANNPSVISREFTTGATDDTQGSIFYGVTSMLWIIREFMWSCEHEFGQTHSTALDLDVKTWSSQNLSNCSCMAMLEMSLRCCAVMFLQKQGLLECFSQRWSCYSSDDWASSYKMPRSRLNAFQV